jgi:hypothetical protein
MEDKEELDFMKQVKQFKKTIEAAAKVAFGQKRCRIPSLTLEFDYATILIDLNGNINIGTKYQSTPSSKTTSYKNSSSLTATPSMEVSSSIGEDEDIF